MTDKGSVDQLDVQLLADYLTQHVVGFEGPVTATKFAGGQSNPTFKLVTTNQSYVLRRQPPGNYLSLPMPLTVNIKY